MNIGELMSSLMNQMGAQQQHKKSSCMLQTPIQPSDNVGQFGNEKNIHIKLTSDGAIEIDSKDMAIKLSKDVFEAIKSFINKGE